MIEQRRWKTEFIDCVIIAQKPKMAPHYDEMRRAISTALEVPKDRVSVKASTTEGLGFLGAGDGIAAIAVSTLVEIS